MATKACTIVSQGWGNLNLNMGYGTDAAYAGLTGDNYFVTSLKFTTPEFTGEPASIEFAIVMGRSGYFEASSRLRYAFCTSDANIQNYEFTAGAVEDPNQLTSGLAIVSGAADTWDTTNKITVDASAVKPNTTYYLILWAAEKVSGYGQGMGLDSIKESTPSATLNYNNTYKLSISQGPGSKITIKRNGATLTNGATITYGDALTISFGASTGYNLDTHTVNGSEFVSGASHTVTGDVEVIATAKLKTFALSISAGIGAAVSVKRNGSVLSNGATVSYGDELIISFAVTDGYCLKTHTVNGSDFSSGDTHTVEGNVRVVAAADILSYPIGNGTGHDLYYAYIGDGAGGGDYYVAYIGTDTGPVLYGSES